MTKLLSFLVIRFLLRICSQRSIYIFKIRIMRLSFLILRKCGRWEKEKVAIHDVKNAAFSYYKLNDFKRAANLFEQYMDMAGQSVTFL